MKTNYIATSTFRLVNAKLHQCCINPISRISDSIYKRRMYSMHYHLFLPRFYALPRICNKCQLVFRTYIIVVKNNMLTVYVSPINVEKTEVYRQTSFKYMYILV